MNINTATTEALEARDNELTRNIRSLTQWHNRNMSAKDRQFFADLYRTEQAAIFDELVSRAEVSVA
jgi:hypothetical protein